MYQKLFYASSSTEKGKRLTFDFREPTFNKQTSQIHRKSNNNKCDWRNRQRNRVRKDVSVRGMKGEGCNF
jgi:hypothetical protein